MSRAPDSVDRILAELRARDAARDAFVTAHEGRAFAFTPRATSGLVSCVVSPSCHVRGGWRLTRFDRRGPSGHTEFSTYADAVREAQREYGADLANVTFASTLT